MVTQAVTSNFSKTKNLNHLKGHYFDCFAALSKACIKGTSFQNGGAPTRRDLSTVKRFLIFCDGNDIKDLERTVP